MFSTVKTRRVHFAAGTVRLFSVYLNNKIKELAFLPQETKGISDRKKKYRIFAIKFWHPESSIYPCYISVYNSVFNVFCKEKLYIRP